MEDNGLMFFYMGKYAQLIMPLFHGSPITQWVGDEECQSPVI